MVLELIWEALKALVMVVLGVLPDLPDMPSTIESAAQNVTGWFQKTHDILEIYLGQSFMTAALVIVIGLFTFEYIYHAVMWIIKKLPIGVQ